MKGLQLWSKVQHTLFCREISYVASYARSGGGSQKVTNDDEGEGGSRYPPKMMMSFMKSHLCVVCVSHMCYTCFICVVCVSYMCYTCRPVNYRLLDRRAAGVVISHRS